MKEEDKIKLVKENMKEEDITKLIESLQDIKDKKSVVIDETEALLLEWKKDQERLANLLMSLKSKVKNDEETK